MIVLKTEDYLNVCGSGDFNSVKEYFESLNKHDIESIRDCHKASCLHYAARVGSVDVIQYFIMYKKISPFIVSEIGATVLHDAAVKGQIKVIEWLIKNTELNLGVKDTNGATLMHIAAKFDQVDLIDWAIHYEGVKSIKEQMYNGATCLHFACSTNSIRSVKRILQAVPSLINVQMMNGVTALYLATQENNLQIVRFLTKNGANVKLKATDGMTPFHVACQNGSIDLVNYYLDEFKVNINEKDFNGVTCLHFACINGSEKIVANLLSSGAKILADKNGSTPLHDCAAGGFLECARLLIANNCDVSLQDNNGMSALDIARSHGHTQFHDEFCKFVKPLNDTEGAGIIRLNINDETKHKRNLEKVTVSMSNINDQNKRHELCVSNKENTIISPIFNSQAVVSTSTPSVVEQELSTIQKKFDSTDNSNMSKLEKSYQSLSRQVSSNQGFIKIISESDQLDKQNKISALNELDKCIAEFDKYKSMSEPEKKTEAIKIEVKPSTVIEVKPVTNNSGQYHHYSQSSLPNRPLQDIFSSSGAPPPPPPPLPSTWSSKNIKPSLKKEIETNGVQLRNVNQDKKTKTLSNSFSFIDELQNQFKNGGINLLKNNTLKNESNENKPPVLDNNNNFDSINENRKSFRPPDSNEELSDQKSTIKQISEQRLNSLSKQTCLQDMPEWKRKLIEKKKQQQH